MVDIIGVVALAARDRIDARGAAVEEIIARAAGDDVVAGVADDAVAQIVAGAVYVVATVQQQSLDVGGQREADRGADDVVALARILEHQLVDGDDVIGVVAEPTVHPGAEAARAQRVVAGIAPHFGVVGGRDQLVGGGGASQLPGLGHRHGRGGIRHDDDGRGDDGGRRDGLDIGGRHAVDRGRDRVRGRIGADKVDLHLLRARRRVIRARPAAATDRKVDEHVHVLALHRIGRRLRGDRLAVDVIGDLVRAPVRAVGVPLGVIQVDHRLALGVLAVRIDPVRRQEDGVDVAPQRLEHVQLGRPAVVGRQQPEGGPDALARRQLGAHLEIPVFLREGELRRQQARGIGRVAQMRLGRLRRRRGGDRQDTLVDPERIDAERGLARARIIGVHVDLGLAVQRAAAQRARAAPAIFGAPRPALAVQAERVEIVGEGGDQRRRVVRQHEIVRGQAGQLGIAQHELFAVGELEHRIRADLAAQRLDRRKAGDAVIV